jgi:hypothetical protein
MQVTALEGVVENGQIRLSEKIDLPEKTRVYVIIPGVEMAKVPHVYSPRLAHPEQAVDFRKEVVEEIPDAGV